MANMHCEIRPLGWREKLRLDPLFRASRFGRCTFAEWLTFCVARASEGKRLCVVLDSRMLTPGGDIPGRLRDAAGRLLSLSTPVKTMVLVGVEQSPNDRDWAVPGECEAMTVAGMVEPFAIFGMHTFIFNKMLEGVYSTKHRGSLETLRRRWNDLCAQATQVR